MVKNFTGSFEEMEKAIRVNERILMTKDLKACLETMKATGGSFYEAVEAFVTLNGERINVLTKEKV